MIRLRLPDVLTLSVAASLVACSSGSMPRHDAGVDGPPAGDALGDAAADWQPNLAKSCPTKRWVGFAMGGNCEKVSAGMGWSSSRAFPPGPMNDRGPELGRFCVFESDTPGTPTIDP